MAEPIATIDGRYDDSNRRAAVDNALGGRRRSSRIANLGVFTGYRIGFDIGNGNIGWCILFERGFVPHFLTAEDILAHNATLSSDEPRTQLPNLDEFVPLGTHKFAARNNDGKSLSKVRADARARRRTLDARQARRWHLRDLLIEEDLLPPIEPTRDEQKSGEGLKENGRLLKADKLRVRLLQPGTAEHRHDLGRALYSVLKRRGWMKPVGRAGVQEDSSFGSAATDSYRRALADFGCRTVGEFLDCCQRDAKADGKLLRKRHKPLTWQKEHSKERPKEGTSPKSYEVFPFLSPTFELMWDEANALRAAQKDKFPIADDVWARIKVKASFRRLLKPTKPGHCQFLRDEWRCIRALPSFQEFRVLQQVDNLRIGDKPLSDSLFAEATEIVRTVEKISVKELARRLGQPRLGQKEKDASRTLAGAKTDVGLAAALGDTWTSITNLDERDRWVLRFLSRHAMTASDAEPKPWTEADEASLEDDCERVFGLESLTKIRIAAKTFEDSFADLSSKAAALLAEGYRRRLDHDERLDLLERQGGASKTATRLYERLPYYGEVMPDLTVEAGRFAPASRTSEEELKHGRAPNPDVHVVLNRLRKVTNAIVDMMGGILPSACTVEVAREALSEEAAETRRQQMRAREKLRETITEDIKRVMDDEALPRGPGLDRLVDRWLAAIRQGWRDYDGSEIIRSQLCDGSVYQLDHVSPAAFGEYQQGNLFVSRFNQQKGKQLPWKAFPAFQDSLLAFTQFGLETQRDGLSAVLKRPGIRGRERIQKRADDLEKRIAACESRTPIARPDVLQRLRRTQTGEIERLLDPTGGQDEFKRGRVTAFRPGEQAALFKKLGPDAAVPDGDFAARDVGNIGWSSKLALRYLAHLGVTVVSVKPWAVHALRCMFDINKDRRDLRNHAVDAFLIAHFDARIVCPAFLRLKGQRYEDLYDSRFLELALNAISDSEGVFRAFERNLQLLGAALPFIATAHRPDHKWNPGDAMGGSYGVFGGENIYSFRPDKSERGRLSAIVQKARKAQTADELAKGDLLDLMERDVSKRNDPDDTKIKRALTEKAKVRYRTRGDASRNTEASREISKALQKYTNRFINVEAKFAIAIPTSNRGREIVGVEEFSRRSSNQREDLFAANRSVLRSGDVVVFDSKAWVLTAIEGDARVSLFPVDTALRDRPNQSRPTVPSRAGQKSPIQRIASDVLGQRLHRRRKSPGDLQSVPYPLFGK